MTMEIFAQIVPSLSLLIKDNGHGRRKGPHLFLDPGPMHFLAEVRKRQFPRISFRLYDATSSQTIPVSPRLSPLCNPPYISIVIFSLCLAY